ncbi:MAG: aldehyde dehydrogenase family protein, partial [Luminiphilus sp.]
MLPELNNSSLLHTQAYINGQWVDADSGALLPVSNPATGDIITEVAKVGAEETRRAIEAAEQAMIHWRDTPAKQRAQIMRRWFDLIMANQEDLAR